MEDKYKIPYINACIRAFAKRFDLSAKAAHEYLDQYKGLDFLVEFYEIEHLQSIEDAVDDLIVCCQNNGGCHDNRVAEGNVWVAERSNLLPFRFGTRP